MSEPRVIKKYPNRRLYDTVESRYITLADIRRLVVERVDFTVIDKKTQTDITRAILLQVIAEQEHTDEAVLSRDFLSQVIRSYGGQLHDVVGSYLEQSLRLFNAQQRETRERLRGAGGTEQLALLAQKNQQRWRAVQDEIYRTLLGPLARPREREDEARDAAPTQG